jgi:hypothetical protein
VLDCCHGRILLYSYSDEELVVWDPTTTSTHYVSAPPGLVGEDVAAALVTVTAPTAIRVRSQSSSLDCKEADKYWVSACVYSSETDA